MIAVAGVYEYHLSIGTNDEAVEADNERACLVVDYALTQRLLMALGEFDVGTYEQHMRLEEKTSIFLNAINFRFTESLCSHYDLLFPCW